MDEPATATLVIGVGVCVAGIMLVIGYAVISHLKVVLQAVNTLIHATIRREEDEDSRKLE